MIINKATATSDPKLIEMLVVESGIMDQLQITIQEGAEAVCYGLNRHHEPDAFLMDELANAVIKQLILYLLQTARMDLDTPPIHWRQFDATHYAAWFTPLIPDSEPEGI